MFHPLLTLLALPLLYCAYLQSSLSSLLLSYYCRKTLHCYYFLWLPIDSHITVHIALTSPSSFVPQMITLSSPSSTKIVDRAAHMLTNLSRLSVEYHSVCFLCTVYTVVHWYPKGYWRVFRPRLSISSLTTNAQHGGNAGHEWPQMSISRLWFHSPVSDV